MKTAAIYLTSIIILLNLFCQEKPAMTENPLKDLSPGAVWKHFDNISSIPHCSGNESAVREYIMAYAKKQGLATEADDYGNVKVALPASPGKDSVPACIIQTHIDMVCEKNAEAKHDFSTDPIALVLDSNWLHANGTTLGADNGVGVACALALIEDTSVAHGPLELLFTVEEEVGLVGAGKLQDGFIGPRTLINLDSEDLGTITIGCAGGSSTLLRMPADKTVAPQHSVAALLTVSGLKGGHSGIDIHKKRGNAIKILARILSALAESDTWQLADIAGGNKNNAIPREARATLCAADTKALDELKNTLNRVIVKIRRNNSDVSVQLEQLDKDSIEVLSPDARNAVLKALVDLPHGVLAMSKDIEDLVQTSNNLATVAVRGNSVEIGTMARSSVEKELAEVEASIVAVAETVGAVTETSERYPGWEPDVNSRVLAIAQQACEKTLGRPARVEAIHAGLECGIIGERFPGLDMISIGPDIRGAHSPDERVDVKSVERFWQFFTAILQNL